MKTGLVLEGGAVRTVYSCGVMDAFLQMGLDFNYVVGTSAGIAYGVSFCSRQYGRNLEILTRYAPKQRYMGVSNLFRPGNRGCYFGLKFTYDDIPNRLIPYDYDAFAHWPGVAEAVVTNLETGLAEYHIVDPTEPQMLLLQATCALPLLFPIYEIKGSKYMDGGCADAIPWKRAQQCGCDKIVVVLTRERDYVRHEESAQKLVDVLYHKYPRFLDAMHRRVDTCNRNREALFAAEKAGDAFVFCPNDTQGFSRTERDTQKIRALWQQGYDHAIAREKELRAFLKS